MNKCIRIESMENKLCIDAIDCQDIKGRLYNSYLGKVADIRNIVEFMFASEAVFDGLAFPRPDTTGRSFFNTSVPMGAMLDEVADKMDKQEFLNEKGEKVTFMIQVQFRQNSTWQGTVNWIEQDETRFFRSALELIRLIDSAVGKSEGDGSGLDWN